MPKISFDKIDQKILAALQADGRLSNVDLAGRVALSPSPCLRRVRQLEEAGVITGYRASVDRRAIGLGLTVFVEIKAAKHSRSAATKLQAALLAIPEMVACHIVSGTADFIGEVVVADLEAYERLLIDTLLALPGIADIRSNFAIRTIKSDAPLPLGHLA